jgi:hypothetical protein
MFMGKSFDGMILSNTIRSHSIAQWNNDAHLMSRMEATKIMLFWSCCGEIRALRVITKNHWELEDREVQPLKFQLIVDRFEDDHSILSPLLKLLLPSTSYSSHHTRFWTGTRP